MEIANLKQILNDANQKERREWDEKCHLMRIIYFLNEISLVLLAAAENGKSGRQDYADLKTFLEEILKNSSNPDYGLPDFSTQIKPLIDSLAE